MGISKGEQKIVDILNREGIKFQKEKQFCDLREGTYRYDFWIEGRNILLEYDGQQHFQYTSFFYKKKSDFTKATERDRRKNSYALAHGLPLYRIPFWDIDNIDTFNDLMQEKYLVKSKFHNDIKWREHQD